MGVISDMPDDKTIKVVIILGTFGGLLLGLMMFLSLVTGIIEGDKFNRSLTVVMMVFGWGYSFWGYNHIRKNGWHKDWFKS